jgi:hypothetical protein
MQQQRQLRLGDILDDYCTRERRVTNHAIVAMVGQDVKQTRCTTCDAEHEYKHAKVPRQRRKAEGQAALYSQVAAGAPKRVAHEPANETHEPEIEETLSEANGEQVPAAEGIQAMADKPEAPGEAEPPHAEEHADDAEENVNLEEGPAHRRLIRATLPRPEGQPPPTRPAPEFTIRQPNSRQNRFRPRHQQQRGASPFQGGNRSGNFGGGMPRQGGGNRPPMMSRSGKRHGPKRQK